MRDEILKAADEMAGLAPDVLVVRMLQHGTAGRQAEREKLRATAQREFVLEQAARRRLAVDFGNSQGWTLAKADFGLRTLGQGKMHGGWNASDNPYPGNFHDQFDHPYFYRRGRKAAAIAAHLYNWPGNRDQCEALAQRFGLSVQTPAFPSWWNPGGTSLVVYVGPMG